MDKKEILFLTGYFPFLRGGAEYQAFLLAEHLKGKMNVSFVFRNFQDRSKLIKDGGYTLYAVKPCTPKGLSGSLAFEGRQIYRIMKKAKPDIIYVRGVDAYCMAACLYAKKRNCRTIWHIAHDRDIIPFQYKNLKAKPFRFIDKKMVEYGLRHSDHIIAQTRYQAQLLKKNYQRKCDRIIGNWHPVPENPVQKNNSVIKILWIANIRPFKQPEIFIRLAKELNHHTNIHFIMIGRNEQYPAIKAMAIANKIQVTGELPVSEVNKMQAEVPNNCKPIRNKNGTAPGMWFEKDNTILVSMPGVPFEMKAMMEGYIEAPIHCRMDV